MKKQIQKTMQKRLYTEMMQTIKIWEMIDNCASQEKVASIAHEDLEKQTDNLKHSYRNEGIDEFNFSLRETNKHLNVFRESNSSFPDELPKQLNTKKLHLRCELKTKA